MKEAEGPWAPTVVTVAAEDDDNGIYIIGVFENVDSEWAMGFEIAEGEQAVLLGIDTYCVLVYPGQNTHYGGVLACEINGNEMYVRLSDQASHELGVPTEVRFILDFDAEKVQMLRRGLARVLTSGRAEDIPPHLAV